MIYLVVGGSKSGKSSYGERLAKELDNEKNNLYYIATMNPYDLEDLKRIENHIEERKDYGFKTIEKFKNIEEIIEEINNKEKILYKTNSTKYIEKVNSKKEESLDRVDIKKCVIFIDSITSLLTNEMFDGKNYNKFAFEKVLKGLNLILESSKDTVIISDYLFSDGIIYDSYTEDFRKALGKINKELATIANVVVECSFGNIIIHKGKEESAFEKVYKRISNGN
ncbi:hypothetical protein JCM1393_19890 [Clostridium carnis]